MSTTQRLRITLAALLAAAALYGPSASAQSLLGDTITFRTYYPADGTLSSQQNFLVGAGVECSGCSSGGFVLWYQTLDIGANYIEFRSSLTASFNGPDAIFDFTDLDWTPGASLAGFNLTTDFANVGNPAVAFGADSIRIDLGDSGIGTFWRLDLHTTPVPEPGSLALLGLGLTGLGLSRRRRAAS